MSHNGICIAMRELEKLQIAALKILNAYPESIDSGHDVSGVYEYVAFDSLPTSLEVKIGRYIDSNWTFIDMPFWPRLMLKHAFYGVYFSYPPKKNIQRAISLVKCITTKQIQPVIRAV